MDLLPTQPPSPTSTSTPMSPQRKRSADNMPLPVGKRRSSGSDTLRVVEAPEIPWSLDLPDLPIIENKVIEKQVFTHPSMHGKGKTAVTYAEGVDELEDNEKLEWIGDGILKAVCTRLLHRLWPNMREGPSTTIMSHLVSNKTLAQICQRYGLMQKINVKSSDRLAVITSEKNQANLFESYIAGVYHSFLEPKSNANSSSQTISPPLTPNGSASQPTKTEGQAFDEVSNWLVPLFTPIAHVIRQHLQAEQERVAHHRSLAANDGEDDDGDIDPKDVVGSSSMLNEYFVGKIGTGMPNYQHKPTEGLLWETTCTVTLPNGTTRSASTIQTGKKPGMQVVAHKLLVQLGLKDAL